MKYDGIVIYSDLDGTLLDDNRNLSQENIEAVARFVSQGGQFGVATGRMERTTILNFPDLTINIPSIFFNGALVYDVNTGEELFSSYLPEGLTPLLADITARYPDACCEINVRGKAYLINPNEIAWIQLKREALEGLETNWENVPGGWIKVLFLAPRETLEKIKAELHMANRTDLNIMYSERELLDIMAKDVSKGAALNSLRERFKDEWSFIVTIGDNDNDVELIKAADLGIAVDNARPAVKNLSKHILKSNEFPCIPQVLKIIEHYLPTVVLRNI